MLVFRHTERYAVCLLAWAALAGVMGCASTGPPRAPSLLLPQIVRDLSAQRVGGHVDVRFTVPTLSTDRQPLAAGRHGAGVLAARVCRVPATDAAGCDAVTTRAVQPGEAVSISDALPPAMLLGPALPVRYRVTVSNGSGRSAGPSRDATALGGAAPPPIARLAGTTVSRGIQLTWTANEEAVGTRLQVTTDPGGRVLTVAGDPGGLVDATPKPGDQVSYTVVRTRKIAAAEAGTPVDLVMTGEPATVTVVRSADVFAPAVPAGLVAVALQLQDAPAEVDLSWEPNTEPDLAGYLVERADGAAPATALTTAPVTALSYRDGKVQAGHTYTYTVRAVDRAGNRSRPSAPATESLRP